MKSKPIISIIVPCYNQAQYLEEALQSVLEQSYINWECIIVNDGSPDNTEEIALIWTQKDERFKYIYKENGGLSCARNKGIELAIGEFILPLDADDKIGKNYLKLGIEAFKDSLDLKVVYCIAEKFGIENGTWILDEYSRITLARRNMIFCSAIYRRKDWEMVGGYDVNMKYGWEDWEFWIALLKNGGSVKKIEYFGFYYRIKEQSMIKELDEVKRKELFNYMSVKHADFFVECFGSFDYLNNKIMQLEVDLVNTKKENVEKLKSEKFVIDVFCKTFFGFSIFGKYNKY